MQEFILIILMKQIKMEHLFHLDESLPSNTQPQLSLFTR
jgi:hypothetical protein